MVQYRHRSCVLKSFCRVLLFSGVCKKLENDWNLQGGKQWSGEAGGVSDGVSVSYVWE